MESFAKQCIHNHRNPVVKLNSPCQKLFFSAKTLDEEQLVNEHHINLKQALDHQRVEKRSNRAQAVWLNDDNLAQVSKVVKNLLKHFGFQNKNGIFLYPEETLFLLETNRLELISMTYNSLSIEQVYGILLKTTNLSRYRIYKTLALLGYKLSRVQQSECRLSSIAQKNNKRTFEAITEFQQNKKKKVNCSFESSLNVGITPETSSKQSSLSEVKYIEEILNKARQTMPRDSSTKSNSSKADYYIFCPSNRMKREPDFSLFICEDNILDHRYSSSNTTSIYATCTDDVAFYSFNDVHLPYI